MLKAVTQTCQAVHAHALTTCPFCNFGKSVLKIFISSGLQTSRMRTADTTSEKITKTRKILAQKLHSRLPLLNQDRRLIEGTRKMHYNNLHKKHLLFLIDKTCIK